MAVLEEKTSEKKSENKQTKWSFYVSLMRSSKKADLSKNNEAREKVANAASTRDELFATKSALKTITGGVK